ncbi:hypothetical protein [Haloferula rosea]|uniref:DUF1449 family protein n=1 Tax=Haloferula rosea TaxID=490093 RepID=A0A934RBT1_9BACT|nr:hypothetical protein [Haloferula rosea]MBK1828187.1 hypothetical protein [Haloferula rosea]
MACFLGALDFDFLNIDAGDAGIDGVEDVSVLDGATRWLRRLVYGDDVPVSALFSFILIFEWGFVMLGNYFFNPDEGMIRAAIIVVAALLPALVLTRLTGLCISPFFKILRGSEGQAKPVIGRCGKVRSRTLDARSGQVEVEDPEVPLLINAHVSKTSKPLVRGDLVTVVSHDTDRDTYLVASLTKLDN